MSGGYMDGDDDFHPATMEDDVIYIGTRKYVAADRASQAAPAPQKPVAWAETDHKGKVIGVSMNQYPWHPTPLYAAPAPSDGLREEPCAGTLLEWMTYHNQPLQLWREADETGISEGSWVVVDNHKGTVIGSGPTAEDALREAYTAALTPAPAQDDGKPNN